MSVKPMFNILANRFICFLVGTIVTRLEHKAAVSTWQGSLNTQKEIVSMQHLY